MAIDFGSLPGALGKGLQRVFGSANQRVLAEYRKRIQRVNDLEAWAEGLDEAATKARVDTWRQKVRAGEATLDDALPEMFAMTRVASQRTLGLRHFDVQLIGGAVLHDGNIAEMGTGEGKTLVATLPAALNALSGKGVYIVTVNDYLARRDADWMRPVFAYLGMTVGSIQSSMGSQERQEVYACDVTYGTNNEFGFDYLRDNMKWSPEEQVQKSLNYAIVDEVDSILIDEARTPLIISGAPEEGKIERYLLADRVARQLQEDTHFEVKLKEQQCLLNEAGIERAQQLVGIDDFYSSPQNMEWPHLLEQALRAHHIYARDKNYVVAQNPRSGEVEVIIVDEFTGRLMVGRRWSDGLHQAVEAKEGIRPKEENQTLATITLQNYFRMFDKLAGMTGTAMTEAAEFAKIYKLDVIAIPPNKPVIRHDDDDQVYLDEASKNESIVEDIAEAHATGRPVLVGTTSIERSETLSALLTERGMPHDVLNAKHHEREAEIVAQAGRKGAITVATNMAGRGTDIVLGGNPDMLLEKELAARGIAADSPEAAAIEAEVRARCKTEQQEVLAAGGLYVLGTERHEARRIDNQLRGRCGRQGDPGSTRFYVCFDDDLMRIFARDWVRTMMERMGLKAGERIESPMVSRGIARAQKKVEQRNFDIRKNLIEYDEVMDKQRKFIYSERQEVLERKELREKVRGMFEHVLDAMLDQRAGDKNEPVDYEGIRTWLLHKCPEMDLQGLEETPREELFDWVMGRIEKHFAARREHYGDEDWAEVERFLLLDTIDTKWKDHLHAMEILKAGIGLRGYAQVDPKNEFKKEGFEKFEMLKTSIAEQVTDLIFRVELRPAQIEEPPRPAAGAMPPLPSDPLEAQAMVEAMIAAGQAPPEILEAVARGAKVQIGSREQVARRQEGAGRQQGARRQTQPQAGQPAAATAKPAKKPGRNDPCPCGSGVKYKKCCSPAFG